VLHPFGETAPKPNGKTAAVELKLDRYIIVEGKAAAVELKLDRSQI